jgi:hypothetical protein
VLGRVLPRRLRRPVAAASLTGAAGLAVTGAVWMWSLIAAGTLVEVVLLTRNGRGNGARGRRLGVLLAAAAMLAAAGAVELVVEHHHAQQRRAAEWAHASEINRAQLLPRTPARAAQVLLRAVADGDPTVCTTVLAPAAAEELAAAVGVPDCAGAMRVLADRVVDPQRYVAPDFDAVTQTLSPDGQSATVNVCRLSWDGLAGILHGTTPPGPPPGPQLGRLDLTRVLGQGFQVARFTPC